MEGAAPAILAPLPATRGARYYSAFSTSASAVPAWPAAVAVAMLEADPAPHPNIFLKSLDPPLPPQLVSHLLSIHQQGTWHRTQPDPRNFPLASGDRIRWLGVRRSGAVPVLGAGPPVRGTVVRRAARRAGEQRVGVLGTLLLQALCDRCVMAVP
ncbi:hypothetical protein ZEAMMB73_Zm00001d010428 [Zea mays]|uniref:Uncharacterized protein n=1 Tax=Zea mays TaxID=4577 RepID=A0A1D6FQZ3_MAIZE|nr:hypothetical protein ZEAMMB73_Zm00001d010428 [Zea mays]AQK94040.1 hypothetical protein ZEAMMB73_Zm00001d010428 [Zea mays]